MKEIAMTTGFMILFLTVCMGSAGLAVGIFRECKRTHNLSRWKKETERNKLTVRDI